MGEKVLLHACCAPCATVGTASLIDEGRDLTLYFYGGNIHPESEWDRRRESLQKLASAYGIPLLVRPYDVSEWDASVLGLEGEPEGGLRCVRCMRLQLENAARAARGLGIGTLCTSLTLSPQKHPDLINSWGRDAAESCGLRWEERVWRKKGGFLKSVRESSRLGLYRQNYCGCRFSVRAAVPARD